MRNGTFFDKVLYPFIRNIDLVHTGNQELVLLADIFLSLEYIEQENAERAEWLKDKRDFLCSLIYRNLDNEKDFQMRGKLLDKLYHLVWNTYSIVTKMDKEWLKRCHEHTLRLQDEFIKSDTANAANQAILTLCLINMLYPYQKQDSELYMHINANIISWVEEWNQSLWHGLPILAALYRIAVMGKNSYMLLEQNHDELIKNIWEHYCNTLTDSLPVKDMGLLGLLYLIGYDLYIGVDKNNKAFMESRFSSTEDRTEKLWCCAVILRCLSTEDDATPFGTD